MAFEWFLLKTFTRTNAFFGTGTKKLLRDCYCLDLLMKHLNVFLINAMRLGNVS